MSKTVMIPTKGFVVANKHGYWCPSRIRSNMPEAWNEWLSLVSRKFCDARRELVDGLIDKKKFQRIKRQEIKRFRWEGAMLLVLRIEVQQIHGSRK